MNSFIAIFEIPTTDISRATDFYQALLGIQIEQMEMPGMQLGIFPYENQAVTGVLVQGEGYEPSVSGVTVYLHAGEDLQRALDQIESLGGSIVVPKTSHADGVGFFALILDTEGNRIGLHSEH